MTYFDAFLCFKDFTVFYVMVFILAFKFVACLSLDFNCFFKSIQNSSDNFSLLFGG